MNTTTKVWQARYDKLLLASSLDKTHPVLAGEWHPTKNGDLTPDKVFSRSNKKFWWKCPVADDHEWQARVVDRVRDNTGCPCCSNKKVVLSNCLATTHPEIAKQWHPTNNGGLTPYDVVAGSNKKVWWKCEYGDDHEWEAHPNNRVYKGTGCPCCAGYKVVLSNCLATTHPEIAKEWHPTNNGNLTPYDVSAGCDTNIWWQCPVVADHIYDMKVWERKRLFECPCCAGWRIVPSNCLATTHPEIAKQWHPTRNGDLTPYQVGYGSREKVWWKCPVVDDHEWEAVVESRTRIGAGCACCANKKAVPSNCLATIRPDLAKQWHPTKNGDLTPCDVVAGGSEKVWWECPNNQDHEWEAAVGCRVNMDTGCPFCRESRGEKKVAVVLSELGLSYRRQARFKTCRSKKSLPFDFLVRTGRQNGFLIEFNGEHHYKPIKRGSMSESEAKADFELVKHHQEKLVQ